MRTDEGFVGRIVRFGYVNVDLGFLAGVLCGAGVLMATINLLFLNKIKWPLGRTKP